MAQRNRHPAFDRFFKHPLEATGLYLLVGLLRLLPVDGCSRFFGCLARTVGPRLGISRRARRNLALALPEKSPAEVEEIVRDMWHNLGQVVGEYAHLDRIADLSAGRVEVVDRQYAYALRGTDKAGIICSAHLANWEIMSPVATLHGVEAAIIIREPNNPLVRPMVDRMRGMAGGRRIPTGRDGARQTLELLGRNGNIGLLFDQKMNRGIPVDFFGRPAMTAPGPAQMALRFNGDIVPVRIERMGPARFRVTIHPPLGLPKSGDKERDVAEIMGRLNKLLEGWIRERPAEWLWLHRRWPAEAYRTLDAAPSALKQT